MKRELRWIVGITQKTQGVLSVLATNPFHFFGGFVKNHESKVMMLNLLICPESYVLKIGYILLPNLLCVPSQIPC